METLITQIVLLLNWLAWSVLAIMILFLLIMAIAGHFRANRPYPPAKKLRRIAVLIPSYKEDQVILEVAADALHQDYPSDRFEVVVIADHLRPETIDTLKTLPIRVIEVQFEKSTKARALNFAMNAIGDGYDIAVVLDADNLMDSGFLRLINDGFDSGANAIQGHRLAKNTNTPVAILDAISEEINNHIFRKGFRAVGLSSALIGSGMAFNYRLFKRVMRNVDAVGGFDKELELWFTENRLVIEYIDNALCYDEKVQNFDTLGNQRRRWLSVQFIYLGMNAVPSIRSLFRNGNIDYFIRTWQQAILPRILLLGLVTLMALGSLFFWPAVAAGAWILLWLLLVTSLALSIPTSFYNRSLLMALLYIPMGIWRMFLSLIRIKGANKSFIHTSHTATAPHLQKKGQK